MPCSRLLPYRRCHRCGSSACFVRSGNPLRGGTPHCRVPSKRLCQDNCGRRSSRRRGNRQYRKDNAIPHCAAVCRPVLPALHTGSLCLCIAAHERIQPKNCRNNHCRNFRNNRRRKCGSCCPNNLRIRCRNKCFGKRSRFCACLLLCHTPR